MYVFKAPDANKNKKKVTMQKGSFKLIIKYVNDSVSSLRVLW